MNHASHTTTYKTTGARIAAVRGHRSQPQTPNRPARGTHRSIAAGPLAAALIACLAFAGRSHGQFAGFAPPQNYAVAELPTDVAVADLNGNGIHDLVVTSIGPTAADSRISIFLGNGNGSFTPAQTYSVPGAGRSVIGDVNGDGVPDLVSTASGGIAVLLGAGDGTFAEPQVFGVGAAGANSIALGDFNGNGHLDMAATTISPISIALLLGNGDGTFVLTQNVPAGGSQAFSIATADVNLDGKTDLVLKVSDGVSVLLGLGNGTFAPAQVFPAEPVGSPSRLAIADLNDNGIPDVALTISVSFVPNTTGGVNVFLGAGDGTFGEPQLFGGGMASAQSIAITDLDGDGAPDLLVCSFDTATMFAFPGNGDGTFASPQTFETGTHPISIAVGDFNGDGAPDAVVVNRSDHTISVYLNQTDVLPPLAFDLLSPPDGASGLALPETVMTWPGANASLQWSVASSFATTYTLTIALDPGLTSIVLEESLLTATEFDIPAGVLEPGTTYHWGVVAESQGGQTFSTPGAFAFTTALSAPSGCPSDLTGDGAVGVADLLMLLSAWGACP